MCINPHILVAEFDAWCGRKHDGNLAPHRDMHPVLEPFTFHRGGLTVKNRTVLAAMTNKQSHEDGRVSKDEIKWLEARAIGQFGIVCTAATHVQADGQGWEGEFGVWSDQFLPGLTDLASSISTQGARAVAQLFHGGLRAPSSLTGVQPKSASINVNEANGEEAREMTSDEVEACVRSFAEAAKRCQKAGFHGVELHGAHGYLISQFLGKGTNRRNDAWGGSPHKRQTFLEHIVRDIRRHTGSDFLVGVRLSPVLESIDLSLEDALYTLEACTGMELDFIHVSCWDITKTATRDGVTKTYTEWFADQLGDRLPLITTGGIWDAKDAEDAVEQGATFVGVARAGIAHPSWPRQLEERTEPLKRPPFTPHELRAAGLNDTFVDYMRRWDGFVSQ